MPAGHIYRCNNTTIEETISEIQKQRCQVVGGRLEYSISSPFLCNLTLKIRLQCSRIHLKYLQRTCVELMHVTIIKSNSQ